MSDNAYRHHRAHPAVIFVPVPVPAAGSPAPLDRSKPGKYPVNQREAWRPQRSIPSNRKAEASVRLMQQFARQDLIVSEFMRPRPT